MNNKFKLGQLVATNGVDSQMKESLKFSLFVSESVNRHANGDWGDLCQEDKNTNEEALTNGDRIFSKYKYDDDTSIYIITEWDRSATTILFPNEY